MGGSDRTRSAAAVSRRKLLAVGLAGATGAGLALRGRVVGRSAPAAAVQIDEIGGKRRIVANGVPGHDVGDYPDPHDPFPILAQDHRFEMPLVPEPAAAPMPLTADGFWHFGVAVNGVPFDPAGPYWQGRRETGWQFEVLSPRARPFLGIDQNNAHVQPGGGYHYHGLPDGLLRGRIAAARGGMVLLGWAADGFPIYAPFGHAVADDPDSPLVRLRSGYSVRTGPRPAPMGGWYSGLFVEDHEYIPGLGDLDECNGRTGVTPEFPGGTYHYLLTDAFPFVPRVFRGRPDPSFRHRAEPGEGEVPPALRDLAL